MFRAVRTLAKEPGFILAAMATLALGIASSTTMFSVLDAVLIEPVPHADSARVVALETRWKNTGRITRRGALALVGLGSGADEGVLPTEQPSRNQRHAVSVDRQAECNSAAGCNPAPQSG